MLDYKVILFLTFWGNSRLFSIVATSVYILTSSIEGFPLHLCQHLLSLDFLIIDILTDKKWHLMILICISLMNSDFEHFMYVPKAWGCFFFFFEKCLFRSFAHLLIRYFVFLLLSCTISLFILNINPLSDIWFAYIFPHSIGCFLFCCFFCCAKFFSLM